MLDWNDVQFFLAIHRAQTLAGAARALKVEHTTVGRRLSAMEKALRAKLFVRTPDGFRPTRMGAEILPLAEQAEASLLQIERVALAADERAEGTVRVTTSESFAPLLGRWLVEMRLKHQRITVEVLTGNALLDLTRREADIAVRFAPTVQDNLVCRRVAVVGWAAYAAPSYVEARGKLPPSGELAGHDVIAYNESLARSPGGRWIGEHAAGANIVLRSGSIMAAHTAAAGGLGIALLPCFAADSDPALAWLTAVVGSRDGYLVVHPDLARVARIRVVLAFLVECFARNPALFTGGAAAEPAAPRKPRRARAPHG